MALRAWLKIHLHAALSALQHYQPAANESALPVVIRLVEDITLLLAILARHGKPPA